MNAIESFQKLVGAKVDGDLGVGTMKAAMKYFKWTPENAAHFFGQTCHESGHFKIFSENLNYSAAGLMSIFKKYFPTLELAKQYERKPDKIANRVYGGRMGNGDEASGEGHLYRGRGPTQLTGKSNYTAFAKSKNDMTIVSDPNKVATEYAFDSAIFFFTNNKIWDMAKTVDDSSILRVTKAINGGTIGIDERAKLTREFYAKIKA